MIKIIFKIVANCLSLIARKINPYFHKYYERVVCEKNPRKNSTTFFRQQV